MEEIEIRKRPGRPRKLNKPASKTISVELDEYEEISTEAKKQGLSFFEFTSMLYHAYAKDNNREILNTYKELKETKEELEKLKRENEDLSNKLTKIYLNSKKSIDLEIDKDSMISEVIDKIDEFRLRFESDIQMARSGELSLIQNREILKNRRDLFRQREAEYIKLKKKLAASGIHDIDDRLNEFETLMWEAKKALGIAADKDDKNSLIIQRSLLERSKK